MNREKSAMNRRAFVKATAVAVAGVGLVGNAQARSFVFQDEKHAREYDSNKALLDALKYVDKSEVADQNCANCQLYTATKDNMGKCQLIPNGLVAKEGHCISWTKKVS